MGKPPCGRTLPGGETKGKETLMKSIIQDDLRPSSQKGSKELSRRDFLRQSRKTGIGLGLAAAAPGLLPESKARSLQRPSAVTAGAQGEFVLQNRPWHALVARRPVFTVDYWPGIPALEQEGREEISWDLQHIRAYADSFGVRTMQFILGGEPHAIRGAFRVPDLLKASDPEIAAWQEQTRRQLQPLLRQYSPQGLQSILLTQTLQNSGRDASPEWYHQIEHWEECDLQGRPLSEVGGRVMACMFHPQLYEVIDRFWEAIGFLKKEAVLVGACIDNEPHLGGRGLSSIEIPQFGGNPHTRRAFGQFLAHSYGEIQELNQVAGTDFRSFDEIQISDSHWLIRTLLRRFLSTIVMGQYQTKLAAIAKRHVPHLVTITRLVSGYWRPMDRESPGAEGLGVESTLLKDSQVDLIAWSHYWHADQQSEILGQLQVTAGLLRGVGKPVGVTEPMVNRNGIAFSGWRPQEVEHFVYRGLFYHLGMFNLHSWDRIGRWAIYNEPFGMALSQRPGYLQTVRKLRNELEWMAPYQTFGDPVMPPLRILVSRHARYFPGMGGYLYQNWLRQLCKITEFPEYSGYEVLEEQTHDLPKALQRCKGLVVVDACLEPSTRHLLQEFVARGGRLLVIGAPALRDPLYRKQSPLPAYPIRSIQGLDLSELEGRSLPAPVGCSGKSSHPVWPGVNPLQLCRPTEAIPAPGSITLAVNPQGAPVVLANSQVVYMSGFPYQIEQQKALLAGFSEWCGVPLSDLVISRFEKAVVVQNWDPRNHRYDGSILDPRPWRGRVRLPGTAPSQIRELRQDHPWLAYHREGKETVLEGVQLNPLEIKVFRRESAAELPHFEGLPETLGFTFWWRGQIHPATGRFGVKAETTVKARFVSPQHQAQHVGWYVTEVAGKRIAEGRGFNLNFQVSPGRDYYLTTFLLDHPHQLGCPLCQRSAFE